MYKISSKKSGSFFDSWVNNKLNKPKKTETTEAQEIFVKLTDPALKTDTKVFCITAEMQTGKTQYMLGIACLWLDRYPNARVFLTTSYSSKAHTQGLRDSVSKLISVDNRLSNKVKFYEPHNLQKATQEIREIDLVFFDEDHYGTSNDAETRYKKLVRKIAETGCMFGAVGATNISMFDAAKDKDIIIHKTKLSKNYRGLSHIIDCIENGYNTFEPYIPEKITHIAQELCKHSADTLDYQSDSEKRWGVYLVRIKNKKLLDKFITKVTDWGMDTVIAMLPEGKKVMAHQKLYEDGLDLLGLDEDSSDLMTIISTSFDYVKQQRKDLIVIIDGSLGCGVNLDKLVDKTKYEEYEEYTELVQQNKPFVKGIIESSNVVTSLLQGLPGRICRYVDDSFGKTNPMFEKYSSGLFISFNKEAIELGMDIMNNPFEFQKNQESYVTRAEELGVSLYSKFESDIIEETDFSEGILVGDYKSYSEAEKLIATDILNNGGTADESKLISIALHNAIILIKNTGRLSDGHLSRSCSGYASFSTSEYNLKPIGEYLKFNFRNNLSHDKKPNWGIGFDKIDKKIRLFSKGDYITNYSSAESLVNTAHTELF